MKRLSGADVSLIVTTYNWPEALKAVLDSIHAQTILPREVVVADDGSGEETRALVERERAVFPCELVHVWHPDEGYQVARIRNRAAQRASGDYLVFIDGDCLLRPDFLRRHVDLARPRRFVAGNRVLLTPGFTETALNGDDDVTRWSPFDFSRGDVNRRWSLVRLPMGGLRYVLPWRWKGVITCNMALYHADFTAANGFEEQFEGWGYEDSDLAVRLHHLGVRRTSGRFAVTVLHLWHRSNKSSLEKSNWARLQETINSDRVRAIRGIDQIETG